MNSAPAPSLAPTGIPHEVFDAHLLPPHERFAVWRESVLPLFEPLLDEMPPEGFYARLDGFNLRRLVICLAEFSEQRYLRRSSYSADEGADHLLVQLYLAGGYVGLNGMRKVHVGPGDISLLDLGLSLETLAESSSAVSLVIPRELMFSFVRPEQLDVGCVITAGSAVGRILGHHLTSVWRALRTASADEGERISRTLLGAVAGAFSERGERAIAKLTPDGTALDAIRAYIDHHLLAGDLTPEHLCRRFACSPAQLQHMFQPLGGVETYIQRARLKRCLQDLSDPCATARSRDDVPMYWGFRSYSHFSQLFREHFDMTAGEALERARLRRDVGDEFGLQSAPSRPVFHDWLRQL